jgi:hypothetical protein
MNRFSRECGLELQSGRSCSRLFPLARDFVGKLFTRKDFGQFDACFQANCSRVRRGFVSCCGARIHEGVYISAVDSIAVRHASHDHGIDDAMLQHLGFEDGEAEVRVRVANEIVSVH